MNEPRELVALRAEVVEGLFRNPPVLRGLQALRETWLAQLAELLKQPVEEPWRGKAMQAHQKLQAATPKSSSSYLTPEAIRLDFLDQLKGVAEVLLG